METKLAKAFWGHSLSIGRLTLETIAVVAAYWLLAAIAFACFNSWGIMPMPVSLPAGLALVFAVLRRWQSGPGIFIGTIVANASVLGAPMAYSMCVGLSNCMGALTGGLIVRHYMMRKMRFGGSSVLICFFVSLIIPPVISASGGMSCKWLLGLVPYGQFFIGWLKWVIAHATGILLFGLPILAGLAIKESGR